jgi:hypothetical protein
METVVYDSPSGKSSVRFSSVEVPPSADGKLRMSSLVIVKRSEKVPEKDRPLGNPLLVNDLVLHPNLGESISKASKEVGFYFAAYLNRSGTAAEAALELSLNGAVLANLPLSLGKPDAAGRVQQVGRLPLDQLAPGTYELRAAVKQGADQVSRSTLLRITE